MIVLMQIGIRLHMPRQAAGRQPEQVVIDEHLSIAAGAGADADGGNFQLGGDLPGRLGRDALQHDGERPACSTARASASSRSSSRCTR